MDGQKLKAARERRGWSQAKLASKIGVGYKTVGNWENGHTVPLNRLGMLRDLFGDELELDGRDVSNPFAGASDAALLSELLRRAIERGEQ